MDTDTSRGGGGGEKKSRIFFSKNFLSPVAGQVVDVGVSWAGGVALLRVDLTFGPIGEKSIAKPYSK